MQQKYTNSAGEKSKAQIKREQLTLTINDAVSELKKGNCSDYYEANSHAQFIMRNETKGLRVLLAKADNISVPQLEELLKDCKKSQHHIARKLIMERLDK